MSLRHLGDKILMIVSTIDEASPRTYLIENNIATSPAHSKDKSVTSDTDSDNYFHTGEFMTRTIEAEKTATRSGYRHDGRPGNSNHPPEHQTTLG
ncbi:unnamed protein product [Clavelina lepadiformis]|uniref:Uncharacterized protein n=1 Tax=Clavelina lepadiformis TaxID=159417 RepID=A0ABP0F3W1_CLALP